MSQSSFYSFEETDALLDSLSKSSIPQITTPELSRPSSTNVSTYGGVTPEEPFFQNGEWNSFDASGGLTGFPNDSFLGFNIDDSTLSKTRNIDAQNRQFLSPESLHDNSSHKDDHSDNGNSISKDFESDDDEDDDDDKMKGNSILVKKENSFGSVSKITKPKKDRSSHNMIEKKYRTNINTKITTLRDAVPTLRMASGDPSTTMDDLEGLFPPSKVNKASVLTKATEYIKHLEKKNGNLLSENQHLRQVINNLSPQLQQQARQQSYLQFTVNQSQQSQQPIPSIQNQQVPPTVHAAHAYPQQVPPSQVGLVGSQSRHPYDMGVPGKALMGGLTFIVGSELFNGSGNGYDYHGLSAFPILSAPQFHYFTSAVKFLFVAFSVLYIFVPSIFLSFSNNEIIDENRKQSQTHLPNIGELTEWYELFKELVFIHVGDKEKVCFSDTEVAALINNSILNQETKTSFFDLLFILMKLFTFQLTFEVSFGKIIISKLLLAYSRLSSSFNILNKIIEKSLNDIANQKVTDTNLRYLYKEFKVGSNDKSEAIQRLLNLSMGLKLSHNCFRGINDKGYKLILNDDRVNFDYKQLLSSLRSNEIFREVLLGYINLNFKDSHEQMDDDELKDIKKDLWNKLSLSESLAPKKSIIDIRIKLLKSILNEKYLDSTLNLINEESKALKIKSSVFVETNKSQSDEHDFESEVHEIFEENDDDDDDDDDLRHVPSLEKVGQPYCDPRFQKHLSQDLLNTLVSSTIMKYSRSSQREETSKLLRYIKLDRNEISLLSFISLFKLVQKFPKGWMVYSSESDDGNSVKDSQFDNDFETIENIVANLRLWIGESNNLNFKDYEDDGLQLKREISDKLVQVSKSFGYEE